MITPESVRDNTRRIMMGDTQFGDIGSMKEQPETEQPTSSKTHVVQPGETLYRIAMNYYNSPDAVEKIKSANGLSSNSISTGQTIILP